MQMQHLEHLEIYHEQMQQQLEHHEQQQQQQQQQKEADGQQAQVEEPVAATPPLLEPVFEPVSEPVSERESYPWEPDYELGRDPYMRLLCLGCSENEIRRLIGMPPRD
jgi:hypothetical protein